MALTVTAGGPATAAQYNALIPLYYVQASDQALATTTFTDHNLFAAIPIAAGATWTVRLCLANIHANAGNDIKVRWQVTGTVTGTLRHIVTMGTTATTIVDAATLNIQSRTLTASVSGGSMITDSTPWFEDLAVAGGASGGTLTLQWAQAAAVSGTTTTQIGSTLVLHRVI